MAPMIVGNAIGWSLPRALFTLCMLFLSDTIPVQINPAAEM